jgi:hypothetical protein
MLYLIGGASRAGKTNLARRFTSSGISCFSLDYLTQMFHEAAPQLGILYDSEIKERAQRLWPFVKPMLDGIAYAESHYAVEGHPLLPSDAARFKDELGSDKIRVCFLGYPNCTADLKKDNVKSFASAVNNWLQGKPDEDILRVVTAEIEFSRYLQHECRKYGLEFFDTSYDYWGTIHLAFDYMLVREAGRKLLPVPMVS